jgi:hypothetical protein
VLRDSLDQSRSNRVKFGELAEIGRHILGDLRLGGA